MKRILSWLLLLAVSLNAMAANGNVALLERHIDDFTYATTVDSDGNDPSVQEAHVSKLVQNLKDLQAAGLTQKEVISLLEKKIQNPRALEALKLKISLLGDAKTDEELKSLFAESKEMYSRGASWNGDAGFMYALGGIGILLIAIAAYKFWWAANYECVEWKEEYQCHQTRCETAGSGDHESTICHGETCGMFNECVRHEKKGN